MHNRIRLFLLMHKKEQPNRWVSKKDANFSETCSFFLSQKEQAKREEVRWNEHMMSE